MKKIKEFLRLVAEQGCWSENGLDFDEVIVEDFAGGNVDNAYWGGSADGEVRLAKKVLEMLVNIET